MLTSTVDIVTLLPASAREQAVRMGTDLCGRMLSAGIKPAFTLGSPFPGAGRDEVCEPHVSLFMLEVATDNLPDVAAALTDAARSHPPFAATGTHLAHNSQGAPELYFEATAQWRDLQRDVIDRIEPARHRDLLRPVDPAGRSVAGLIRESADRDQVRQLTRYGYDEVHDAGADRFRPHVTLAWPAARRSAVDLSGLPAGSLDHVVSEVAVALMHPYGTCTTIRSRTGLGQ